MTKQEYIDKMEKAREHSLTKRWNILIEQPKSNRIEDCGFCTVRVSISCRSCPLSGSNNSSCCTDLYYKFERNPSRKNAQKVFDYIKNVDIKAFADKLEREGIFSKGEER